MLSRKMIWQKNFEPLAITIELAPLLIKNLLGGTEHSMNRTKKKIASGDKSNFFPSTSVTTSSIIVLRDNEMSNKTRITPKVFS